jgi:hypothetical protein
MKKILVDSNIILDIFTEDPIWFEWSSHQLAHYVEQTTLFINPIIYAEISMRFSHIEALEQALPHEYVARAPLPLEAAFLAGKVFMSYKKNGGNKQSTLPDFFIGAHALVDDMRLLTRDVARYQTYFPKLSLITPSTRALSQS